MERLAELYRAEKITVMADEIQPGDVRVHGNKLALVTEVDTNAVHEVIVTSTVVVVEEHDLRAVLPTKTEVFAPIHLLDIRRSTD